MSRPLLIAGTILGFIFWWPVGLAILFVAIWSKRMGRMAFGGRGYGPGSGGPGSGGPGFGGHGGWGAPNTGNGGPWTPPWAGWKSWCCSGGGRSAPPSSGNHAFDEYRQQTLKRLEDEQQEFSSFLERLRFARDKAEFDQFMADRRQPPVPTTEPPHPEN